MPEEWEAFLDPETGEIITVTDEDRFYLEEDGEEVGADDLPEWQRESLERAGRALASGSMLRLPDKFEVHEWDIMRKFSQAQAGEASAELLDAIHGTGAFRMFRATAQRLGLRDAWYAFRDEAMKRIATDWLEVHGIAYVEGTPPVSPPQR